MEMILGLGSRHDVTHAVSVHMAHVVSSVAIGTAPPSASYRPRTATATTTSSLKEPSFHSGAINATSLLLSTLTVTHSVHIAPFVRSVLLNNHACVDSLLTLLEPVCAADVRCNVLRILSLLRHSHVPRAPTSALNIPEVSPSFSLAPSQLPSIIQCVKDIFAPEVAELAQVYLRDVISSSLDHAACALPLLWQHLLKLQPSLFIQG